MAKKNAKQRRKEAKGESAQSFLPIRDIRNSMVETTDGRYLKILEIEPINFYQNNKNGAMLYVCSRYPECDAYVRVQPGTTIPLGTLANGELRALRRETHQYFDKLYTSGRMTKQEAYRWLANFLQAPQSQAHIGYLGEYTCRQVLRACKEMLGREGGAKAS